MRIRIDRMEVVVPSVEQQAQALQTAKVLRQELERRVEPPSRGEGTKRK